MKTKYIYLILVALCFLVYANSLNNAFVSDDIPGIVKNPFISRPWRSWLEPASLLNSLNYFIGKYEPFIYHFTNIILHCLNTILVFFFLRLLFKSEISLLAACLFAVHPIHTEAVTWISGRPYPILSLFILVTFFLYHKATNNTQGFKWIPYLSCLLLFSYYLMGNPSFYFVFPFFLILWDVTFSRWRKTWKWWIPFLGILSLRLMLAKTSVSERLSYLAKDMGVVVSWTNPIFNLVYSLFSHLGLLVWPAKLTLYHEPAVISTFNLTLGIIILFILVLALPFIFKKARKIFLAIALFILFLTPTYSPIMISWLIAERYLYFPSIMLSIFAGFFYERAEKLQRKIALALFIFIIAAYGVRTVARNEDWKSPERFWRSTLLVSYNSPRAHNNMGDVYSQEGNIEGAIREFKRAIELKPDYADVYHNLASTYYRLGNIEEAIKLYKQAIRFKPDLFESYLNLGIIYVNKGEYNLAIEYFKKAVELRPDDANARAGLNFAREKQSLK